MTVKSIILNTYRTVGLGLLAVMAGTFVIYGLLLLFFVFNNSWIAPTILSPTSDKMLQYQAGHLQELQQVSTLKVLEDQQTRAVNTLQWEVQELSKFRNSIQNGHPLLAAKTADIQNSSVLLPQLVHIAHDAETSQKMGLITNDEYTQTVTSVQQFRNSITDSKIGSSTLTQQLIGLNAQIQTLVDQINTGRLTVDETQRNLVIAENAVQMLDQSAYAHALDVGSNMAFIPYDNLRGMSVGEPVYDCYLMVVFCYKVGTIKTIYHDEQLMDYPVFNIRLTREVRGILVDLNITKPRSMRSLLLFIGHKPLLF